MGSTVKGAGPVERSEVRTEQGTEHDGVSGQGSLATSGGECRAAVQEEGSAGAGRAGRITGLAEHIEATGETPTSHLQNALAALSPDCGGVAGDLSLNEPTRAALRAVVYRIEQAVVQLKHEEDVVAAERAELAQRREDHRVMAAMFEAPRPVSSSPLINTHRGDTLAVVMSDGSVWHHMFVIPVGGAPGRYEWQPQAPIPNSRAFHQAAAAQQNTPDAPALALV